MTLSLDTAYRSFGGEVEASSTPTICRLPDSRRHQLWAIAHALGWLKSVVREAAYGKTVWSWRPLLVSSGLSVAKPDGAKRAVNSQATEARRIRLRGELGISRKAIAQG